jgi:hypothetical protein
MKFFSTLLGTTLVGIVLAWPIFAQTIEKKALSLDGAKKAITAAVAEAKNKRPRVAPLR